MTTDHDAAVHEDAMTLPEEDRKKKANVRLALILASMALVFFIGFFVRIAWLR